MKKYILPLLLLAVCALFAGCGGNGSDDSKAKETMRHLKDTDRVTLRLDVEESPALEYTFDKKTIQIEGSERYIRCEIVGGANGALQFAPKGKKDGEEGNYAKYVQLDDGSVCYASGVLNEDGVLVCDSLTLLCPGELEIGTTWESEGCVFTATAYQYVCDEKDDVYGAFLVECVGDVNCKVWWAAKEIGFPVKAIYDTGAFRLVKYENDI